MRSSLARLPFAGLNPLWVVLVFLLALLMTDGRATAESPAGEGMADLTFFAGLKDRSTGTIESEEAAEYILKSFQDAGLTDVGVQKFLTPVPVVASASLEIDGQEMEIFPWGPNMAYLPVTPEGGIQGRLLYAGDGGFSRFNDGPVNDRIVLMDMASYGNWINADMVGAKALIFLGDERSVKGEFEEKRTPTPLAFPRYWVRPEDGRRLKQLALEKGAEVTVKSRTRWENKLVRNCFGFVRGKDPKLKNDLIVLDAFYDASSHILGLAPGADEATSMAVLLSMARKFAKEPPDRSVLFLATTGNGQGLAGMRQFIWALSTRKKLIRKETRQLKDRQNRAGRLLDLLQEPDPFAVKDAGDLQLIWDFAIEKAKDKTDALTRETQYQKALSREGASVEVEDPRPYRRFSWLTSASEMTADQKALALKLLDGVKPGLRAERKELKLRQDVIKSNDSLRSMLDDLNPILFLSLYLSTHSPHIGLVEMGDTYPVREDVRRIVRAARLSDLLSKMAAQTAAETGLPNLVRSTTKGNITDDSLGKSLSASHPCCDVGALAGLPSVSLMTLDDYRSSWSTPNDTLDRIDPEGIASLSRFVPLLLARLLSHPSLQMATEGGIRGLASLEGQTMFVRQGELFPDQPAPGTVISVIQGKSIFRAMSFLDGTFFIPGLANKRVVLEKLILEPYGIDPETGRVTFTADKVQTGKVNYRIKVKGDLASTSLTMFHCQQTDVVRVFNPQNMGYLTKVELLDARTEATPLRYWYSRVDGRDTTAISVFLEKGTRFKLIESESLLTKELFLLNNSPKDSAGQGFLIGTPATVTMAPFHVAKDMHLFLGKRLANLFQHGIVNRSLGDRYESSGRALEESQGYLERGEYGPFWNNVVSAWAKLDSIYDEIEKTQRDVLTGVMFFIALFVPFAYCVERYLFAFRGIYQQITGFFLILVMTILAIRGLHPAFQLTYSPMVVIIAFFIVGLSLLVSWIIFMRFETEMADLHSRTAHLRTPQASKWQAFGAGFSIGVSNLNRRKLRTGLTCITLVILTFTVMSFTNVKSLHKTTSTRIADTAPYEGILLRHQYWLGLPLLTLEDMKTRFAGEAAIWPRAWIEPPSSSVRAVARIFNGQEYSTVEGVLGLGAGAPKHFLGLITHGRWLKPGEENAVLLPETLARQLGLDPQRDVDAPVRLMGDEFKVVGYFDPGLLATLKDLDDHTITPAYLEVSQSEEVSEVEIEAMQSGEVVLPSTERFRYANADTTVIIPFKNCIYYGGALKAISILPGVGRHPLDVADQLSTWLDFPLFVGENGTWFHSANTTLRYQGVANLLVPILIVIFITLNTLIGHVHERQKEIGTYTSVGLAPTHVGFLFIVEALSMAVISTVVGYILAQLTAKYLGGSPLFSQLTFNYSSLASVACMFLVFSVVFLAALYPARMAAEIAMPDVNRSWGLPDPEGDALFMNLPFLLKYDEEKGIMGFLTQFYSSHQDVAQGTFIVDETELDVEAPEVRSGQMPAPVCLLIRTNVWLAPFDFGIKQRMQLHCCPSPENPGYLEIAIQMIRLSGERSAWARANRSFIKSLRKQMLLWRLLDQEAKRHYQGIAPVDYAGQLKESAI